MAMDLHGGMRLVFEAATQPLPLGSDGQVDWQLVTSIRIVYIGDYHDE
jgi:hypothetical protein